LTKFSTSTGGRERNKSRDLAIEPSVIEKFPMSRLQNHPITRFHG